MTFEELVVAVHDWSRRLPPKQVCAQVRRQLDSEEGVEGFWRGISVEAVLVMVRMGIGQGMRCVGFRGDQMQADSEFRSQKNTPPLPEPAPKPKAKAKRDPPAPALVHELRGRPSKRAQALVCEQLADGPKLGDEIQAAAQAAEIPERALIAAASALGVRTRKGQWWLPDAAHF